VLFLSERDVDASQWRLISVDRKDQGEGSQGLLSRAIGDDQSPEGDRVVLHPRGVDGSALDAIPDGHWIADSCVVVSNNAVLLRGLAA
jgi:hypothetical protein